MGIHAHQPQTRRFPVTIYGRTVDGRNPFRTMLKPLETIRLLVLTGESSFYDFLGGAKWISSTHSTHQASWANASRAVQPGLTRGARPRAQIRAGEGDFCVRPAPTALCAKTRSPSEVPFLTPFFGEGSPTKIDYREKNRVPLF